MTLSRSEIKRRLTQAGAAPRKSLGQNFVTDPNTVRRIARLSEVGPGSNVVEIGAGLGSLTLALAQTGANVLAIETDTKLVGILRDVLKEQDLLPGQDAPGQDVPGKVPGKVVVLEADARRLDWPELLSENGQHLSGQHLSGQHLSGQHSAAWHLVANLPYNIATSLVLKLLDEAPQIQEMLVMCQREAAERLVADAGDAAYGEVSVRVRMRATAELAGAVPATVFWPEPAVESALVRITRTDTELPHQLAAAMRMLLHQTFGRRRKMLRRSLRGGEVGLDADTAQVWLAHAGIKATARPEELGLPQWRALAEVMCAARPIK